MTVKLKGIRVPDLRTHTIMKALSAEGDVCFVQMWMSKNGTKEPNATVKFSRPPANAFWNNNGEYWFHGSQDPYIVGIELYNDRYRGKGQGEYVNSPTRNNVSYPATIKLIVNRINFGIMFQEDTMMVHHVVEKYRLTVCQDPIFEVDLKRLRIKASFDVLFYREQQFDRVNRYMVQIPFSSLAKIQHMDIPEKNAFAFKISMASPPQFYRKSGDDAAGHSDENLNWNEWDTWLRQTDIMYNGADLQNKTVSLHNQEHPTIDIGKKCWTLAIYAY